MAALGNFPSFDVAVVGCSVVGCKVAELCAQAGLSVAVIEEDPVPGKYGRCTAIVSRRGLDSIGADYSPAALNEIHGANVFSGGSKLAVRTAKAQAVVLDRFKFDAGCAAAAEKAGARFFFNSHFTGFEKAAGGFLLFATNRKDQKKPVRIKCKVLVGADGANSTVAKIGEFPNIGKKDFAACWEGEYERAKIGDCTMAEVYLENSFAKGFFGWAVPCSEKRVRAGLGTTGGKSLLENKKNFLGYARIKKMLGGSARLCREFFAVIPLRPRKRTQKGNILLVGDAAGQAKATTGGGIVFGSRCAKIAADEVIAFARQGKKICYEREWRKKCGERLAQHRHLRTFLDCIPGKVKPPLLGIAGALGLGFALEKFGDMDEILRL